MFAEVDSSKTEEPTNMEPDKCQGWCTKTVWMKFQTIYYENIFYNLQAAMEVNLAFIGPSRP